MKTFQTVMKQAPASHLRGMAIALCTVAFIACVGCSNDSFQAGPPAGNPVMDVPMNEDMAAPTEDDMSMPMSKDMAAPMKDDMGMPMKDDMGASTSDGI